MAAAIDPPKPHMTGNDYRRFEDMYARIESILRLQGRQLTRLTLERDEKGVLHAYYGSKEL